MSQTFQGSFVAMVTPFRNGKVDEAKLRELVEFHVANGTDGLIPCGTTGESPDLNHDEHRRVVEIVIEAARGRIPGHRRHRLELDRRGDRSDQARRAGRRGGRARRQSVLQQADPGRALPPLPCGGRVGRASRSSSTTSRAGRP